MFTAARKRVLLPYLALGFSAALSLISIVAIVSLTAFNGPDQTDGWAIAFLAFLPLCFFFMGLATAQTQTELQELRQQLATLTAQQQTH
jgi:peptidoglycan/LPS O-acetylase OafA/YrhL